MAKVRVHELAKEFGVASKEMEARIKDMGFPIKNYMSTLEDYEVQEIRRRFRAESDRKEKKEAPPKKVVRRRHKVVRIKKVVRLKKTAPNEAGAAESQEEKKTVAPSSEALQKEAGPQLPESPETAVQPQDQAGPVEKGQEEKAPKEQEESAIPPVAQEAVSEESKAEADERAGESPQKEAVTPEEQPESPSEEVKAEEQEVQGLEEEKGPAEEPAKEAPQQEEMKAEGEQPAEAVEKKAVPESQGEVDAGPPEVTEKVQTEAESVEARGKGAPAEEQPPVHGPEEGPSKEQAEEPPVDKGKARPAKREEKTDKQPSAQDKRKKENRSAGPEKAKGKEAPRPEAKKKPKQFVKIVDRVKIDLSKTAKPVRQTRPKQDRAKKGGGGQRPAGGPPSIGSAVEAASGMPKGGKGRKKGKRVVQGSELGGGKRHKSVKQRWGKHKSIDRILAEEEGVIKGKKGGKGKQHSQPQGTAPIKAEKRKFAIYETIQPVEMAKKMGVKVSDIIMKLMTLGVMVTANQSIDYETAALIADEFGYEIEKKAVAEDLVQMEDDKGGGVEEPRPPVITVMGHVDHGKTSLLDAIRRADVAAKEAGGITQHIGAYRVKLASGNDVVFLDTPGHEAFTSMRARGASITDIVVLVVAADDGVMAQTREAIDHSRAAGVPIIVAVNKIDKPGAEPDRVKRELAELGLVPEDWGGDTIFVNVSAKQGTGIDELLDMMVLQAEVLELKADPTRRARGHVIESRLDRGRGPVATLLVEEGTLRVGEAMVAGLYHGKVRAMMNDHGEQIREAGPATPVEIQGLSGVPEPGSEFIVLEDEKKAREVAEYRQRKSREAELVKGTGVSLENMFQKMEQDKLKVFNIVLKADVQGSLEAITDSLKKLATDKIRLDVVRGGIGAITESDVLLAAASHAIILGFNVKPVPKAKALAEQEGVEIRFYDVIYHAIDEIKAAMVGMLEPVYREVDLGRAEVRETFHISKVGTIAGCKVIDGVIRRNAEARLLRDNVVVYKGKIASLKRFKDDVKEVQAGYECGIGFDKFNDIKVGDVIEAYEMEEMTPDLGVSVADQKEAGDKNGE